MAARFSWAQTTGDAPGVRDKNLGSFGELFGFSSDDSFGTLKPAINRGAYSYELWLQLYFPVNRDSVHDIWLWLVLPPNVNYPWTDATLRMGCATQYRKPISAQSDIATTPVPTDDRGPRNVTIGGDLGGILVGPGFSDFIVLQLSADENAARGFLRHASLAVTYLEGDEPYTGP